MTNEEQKIKDIAVLLKGMFTEEEILEMERKYNEIIASGDKCGADYDEVITNKNKDVKDI